MSDLVATERALLTALGTIAEHWAALVEPSSGGGVASKPVPRSLYTRDDDDERDDDLPNLDRRIALRHDVTAALNSWARVIVDDRELTHHLPLGTDTIGLVEFLQRWARWFSGHEAAQDATDEISTWAGRVRAAAVPEKRDWMPLGKCPLEIEQQAIGDLEDGTPYTRGVGPCGGSVRAHAGRDPQCQRCGTTQDLALWERAMFPDVETSDLLLEAEIATFVHRAFGGAPVKPSTIRQWVRREVITSAGKDDKGRSLYNRRDVVNALAEREIG